MKHFRPSLPSACAVALCLVAISTARAQSVLDGFDPDADGSISAVVVQPDGKILLGGDFHALSPNGGPKVTRNCIARLNSDGTLDATFNPNAGSNIGFSVDSIALQADGRILVVGTFTNIGGQARSTIARLDPVTGLADSFNPNPNSSAHCVAVQADGKILVGGQFNSIGGQQRSWIARLDAATGLADSFDPSVAEGAVSAIVVQPDGKILMGGGFQGVGGQTRNRIARVSPDGSLDLAFNPNADFRVLALALQADGKILAGGSFNNIGGQSRQYLARLDATSGLADSFDPNPDNWVYSVDVLADGRILAGGDFTTVGGQIRNHIARLNITTGAADSFDPNADGRITAIAEQPDGKILLGGYFLTNVRGQTRNGIARLEVDGRLDQTFPDLGGTLASVIATAVQPDGKILIGGYFTSVLGEPRKYLARLNTDGTLDVEFNPNADGGVYAIAIQPDGKILVGGSFTSMGGQPRKDMARLDASSGVADSFDPKLNEVVFSIAVQEDGKILIGGTFTSVGNQSRNGLARLEAATGAADSFNANPGNFGISSISLQADGKVLVGGGFQSIGGQTRKSLARLDSTTGLADSFNPNADEYVSSIAVETDGRILASGAFTSIGGRQRRRMARLDPNTSLADSFDPNPDGGIHSMVAQADGKILGVGQFATIGGQRRNGFARLDGTTGAADPSFVCNLSGTTAIAYSVALQRDGKVLVSGDFTFIGGQMRTALARLSNNAAALQNLIVTQSAINWIRGGSSPQLERVTFEYSTDNVNYTSLGRGTAIGRNWILDGLNLPIGVNVYIRARGYYRTGDRTGSESLAESIRLAYLRGSGTASGLVGNVSTRLPVGTGQDVLIEGFIVDGPAGSIKKIIVRAIGASLTPLGVTDALPNPILEVHDATGATVAMNNDWKTTQVGGLITGDQFAEISNSGVAPGNDSESAIIANLEPGSYTAVVRSADNTIGTGVVDAFDLSGGSPAKLANIATRGLVQAGDKLMVAGFIVQNAPVKAVIRAIGPSLLAFGINNALADTTLQLRDANAAIVVENDNWQSDANQKQELEQIGLQPSHDLEAALITTIQPGSYTAQVRGKDNASGIGVVQVYFLQ